MGSKFACGRLCASSFLHYPSLVFLARYYAVNRGNVNRFRSLSLSLGIFIRTYKFLSGIVSPFL